MKRLVLLIFVAFSGILSAQTLTTNDTLLNKAFRLAVWTIDHNTHDGLLEAGAGYGGEWTRDCAINCRNAANLLRPDIAENSLWSVTEDSLLVGHQYWDKILWVIAAEHHFLTSGNNDFLHKAYRCSVATMQQLESTCLNNDYGLFMGPAVFQDGIEAYDEPVYSPAKWNDSYVLHHPHTDSIICLSTNLVYMRAYRALAEMSKIEDKSVESKYSQKADSLQQRILHYFYRPEKHRFYYLYDYYNHPHDYQEGLGNAFALLYGILSPEEAIQMMQNLKITKYGIPSVSPSFPRNSAERPGRHNMMIWPHVNAFYACGCAVAGNEKEFYRELYNMTDLAINCGNNNFYEIYTIDGKPSGGWQCGALWDEKEHQTWCATGFIRLWIDYIFGMDFNTEGINLRPMGMLDGSECKISDISYRNANLSITIKGHGTNIKRCTINGHRSKPFIPTDANGKCEIVIEMK